MEDNKDMKRKKTLAIVTVYSNAADFYERQIKNIFGEGLDVKKYTVSDGSIKKGIEGDLVLTHYNYTVETIKKYVRNENELLFANRTISKEGLEALKALPEGTEAILVNVNGEMAINTISLLYQLNLRHIHLTPYYPGMKNPPKAKVAITPGEKGSVPDSVEKVIDIGDRMLDISTIMEIAVKLDLYDGREKDLIKKYFTSIVPMGGMEKMVGRTQKLQSQLELMMQMTGEGLIVVGEDGRIHSYNQAVEELLGHEKEALIGQKITEVLPGIEYDRNLDCLRKIEDKVIRYRGNDLIMGMQPVTSHGEIYGGLIRLRSYIDSEKQQHRLRAQIIGKGHKARYTFEDLVGTSKPMEKTKDIAQRMAMSDASVLITGETGTGKEIIAQAIHNASRRMDFQFVAINCAALPESLLESELFGYKEGAFTGARRGGRAGLFELSHMGTLFLDEIGEMPITLQSRLLRVLQEREVMRIGGDSVINVDVRVIAATNRNLKDLIREGKFRQDLYFRLHVLPLKVPPLRRRREDIPLLIQEIQKEMGVNFSITEETMKALKNHPWEGNVRELRNCMEYFASLNKKRVEYGDLPYREEAPLEREAVPEKHPLEEHFQSKTPEVLRLLDVLGKAKIERKRMGRRSLVMEMENRDIWVSEQEVRGIIHKLEELGLVEVSAGRGGTKITVIGERMLETKGIGGSMG